MPPKSETGAPANAKLLERHAADAERDVVRIKDEIAILSAKIPQLNGSDEAQRKAQNELSSLRESLNDSYDLWFKLSKQVREYDRAVDSTRREGEKIPVSEAKEIFAQYELSIMTAIECYIISISQKAALCSSPDEFHIAHADAIRTTRETAIGLAKEDGVLPSWLQ